jgi:hypothetical protein
VDPELEVEDKVNPQTINVQARKAKKSLFHKRGETLVVNQTTKEINIWTLTAEAKVKPKTQHGDKKQKQKNDIRSKEENNNEPSRKNCLKNKDKEDILTFSKRNQVLNTEKHLLKKCRRCNFKKRKCQLEPLFCNSIQRTCWACGKVGHYPQSPLCKAKKRTTKKEKKFEKENIKPEKKLNRESMNQVNKRIKQIED